MIQSTPKNNNIIGAMTLLAVLVVARFSCPALSNIPFFSMTFTFIYGLLFLGLFFILFRYIRKEELLLLILMCLYTLYVVIRSVLAQKGLFTTDAFNAYTLLFLIMIYLWTKRQSPEIQAMLLKLIFAALVFNYIYSIWVLTKDPGASRNAAATSVLEKSPYDILNAVGSFDLVYGTISIAAILISMLRSLGKGNRRKLLIWCVLPLSLVFVYMASYATALVLLLFAIALLFGSRNRLTVALLVIGLFLVLLLHEQLGQLIMDQAAKNPEQGTLQKKLYDFGEMLKTFEYTGTYAGDDGRAARMQWSLDTFAQYPLLGGYGIKGARIGGHNELLDLLGKYGILGFGMIAGVMIFLYRDIQQHLQLAEMKTCGKVIFFIWLISAIVNPALFALQILPMFLMLPLADTYVKEWRLPANNK